MRGARQDLEGGQRKEEHASSCELPVSLLRLLEVPVSVTMALQQQAFLSHQWSLNPVCSTYRNSCIASPSPPTREPDISTSCLESALLRSAWVADPWGSSRELRDISTNELEPNSSEVSAPQGSFSKFLSFNNSNLFPFFPCPKGRSSFLQLLPPEFLVIFLPIQLPG